MRDGIELGKLRYIVKKGLSAHIIFSRVRTVLKAFKYSKSLNKTKGKTKENESKMNQFYFLMRVIKQCVGIDISKSTFTASISTRFEKGELQIGETRTFKNEVTGFNQLLRWVRKQHITSVELVYLMEATGVYYESLAHHLFKIKQQVHVVLPNTSKHYFGSLNIKTKTDQVDARILSRFGVERSHKFWQAPSEELLHLRHLTRYYVQLQEQKTALSNIGHSKENSHGVQSFILKTNKRLIARIDKEITSCKAEIARLVSSDERLSKKVEKLQTIKGVGLMTIATVIAETLGFQHVKSAKQLTSYAGYDVVHRESGSSIKGPTRISKKGNKYIQKALFFPAMVSCRYNQTLKENYVRIVKKKQSKMVGQVAIQRKLLILI